MTQPSSPSPTRGSAFNPLTAEFRADPYPTYRRLREQGGVTWTSTSVPGYFGFWLVSRYADVVSGFKDQRLGREIERLLPKGTLPPPPDAHRPLIEMVQKWMVFKDPPDHGRIRKLINQAFSKRSTAAVEPRIHALISAALDGLERRSSFDFIADFAFPIPISVITELLGVPLEDAPRLRQWAMEICTALDFTRTEANIRRGSEVALILKDYFRQIVARHRASPRDDLVGALIEAHDGGDRLSEDELLAMCVFLFFAGHETTVHLLGNGLYSLFRHPEQLDRLKQDPSLIDTAVEELLRYESPQQLVFRYALEPLEIGGVRINRGQPVCLSVGAANRDPEVFSDPDRLDISRSHNRHIAFGMGIHACAGAALARLEAKIAFNMLLARMPNLKRRSSEWRESIMFRGLQKFEVEV